jgi:antitoxin YefM
MRAVTLKEAEGNLQGLVTRVMDDSEPAIVVTESGQQVVLMPLDDYNAWQETHYLLSSPVNAAHLRRSIAEADAGVTTERSLVE